MSRQVNQQPISARLDYDALHMVDQESFISGFPRNRIINEALKLYVAMADARRRAAMFRNGIQFCEHIKAIGLDPEKMP